MPRSYLEDIWGDQVSCQLIASSVKEFCTGGCEDRTPAREAEESLFLEAVARERLAKTYQAAKRFSVCCSDL
jgi:hypothetical protein